MIEKIKNLIKAHVPKNTFLWKVFAKTGKAYDYFFVYKAYGSFFKCERLSDESIFWDKWVGRIHKEISDPETWKKAFPRELVPYINEFRQANGRVPEVLELGSGPISMLGWGVSEGMIKVTAVDPLAKEYEGTLARFKYSHPVKPVKGEGEKLSKMFRAESFDMVYSSNAIDHTISPRRCMENISMVLKCGGIAFLEGYINEASIEGWRGMHRFNISAGDGRLLSEDAFGNSTDLAKGLGLECVRLDVMKAKERARGTPLVRDNDDEWYVTAFKKAS
jgi:SAM-dependent methyltransferase